MAQHEKAKKLAISFKKALISINDKINLKTQNKKSKGIEILPQTIIFYKL